MRNLLKEFKAFAMRGNVIDLAVAVVIGTVFGKVVSSLVDNIIMPTASMLLGGINLKDFAFTAGNTTISYGIFLQSVVDFLIIAWAIFIIIKIMNVLKRKQAENPKSEPEPAEEILLLREIRDSLKKK